MQCSSQRHTCPHMCSAVPHAPQIRNNISHQQTSNSSASSLYLQSCSSSLLPSLLTTGISSTTALALGWQHLLQLRLQEGKMCWGAFCSACLSTTSRWGCFTHLPSLRTCWADACRNQPTAKRWAAAACRSNIACALSCIANGTGRSCWRCRQ